MQFTSSKPSKARPTPFGASRFTTRVLYNPVVNQLRRGSIGTKLFIPIMGSALVGIVGIAFLFGEIVKFQAEQEIQQTLTDRVHVVENTLGQAELLAKSLQASLLTLHVRKAQTPDTFHRLTLELFKSRPDFVMGLGFGQSLNGVLPAEPWFFSYFHTDSGESEEAGQLLAAPNDTIRFVSGNQAGSFYPETDRYQTYFLAQRDLWTKPYTSGDRVQATHYTPIFDGQGKWLGTVFVDIDRTSLTTAIETPVLYDNGFIALLTESGEVIVNPSGSESVDQPQTYQSIPDLASIWPKVNAARSGLVESEQGYWAYAPVAGSNWIAVAFVPYDVVFNRVAVVTVVGTLVVAVLLALTVALSVRYLNRRLRPILDECNRLAEADADIVTLQQNQDEIGRVTTSFFHLLKQLKANEERIRQEVAYLVRAEERLQQAALTEEESRALQAEIEDILDVVSAVEHGNLTVSAQVNPHVTGAIADTLNRLIERLERILATIATASERVVRGAGNLERLSIAVAENAQSQTHSVARVQHLMENVNLLSQDAAKRAVQTNQAVQLAQVAIDQGQHEIVGMTKGIDVLQQGMDQIVKRTHTLTNYIELAGQFAKDQKRIAAMTRILAVNASMLASRAAAQQDPAQLSVITREFETIAAQVNTLATQTNQSLVMLQQRTDQIHTVVSGLSHDVQGMSHQITSFTAGVHQSQQAFDTVRSVNEQVMQLGEQVSQSSQAIAGSAQTTLQSVLEISTISDETLSRVDLTQRQARQIEQLAKTLLQNVNFFQLQPQNQPKPELIDRPVLALIPSSTTGLAPTDSDHHLTVDITASQPDD
ncbi:methyl-accepting chemotaxis protein [Oculatella sp. LEGE 06141]|uniref:methyl-accepting chemotaxis protein n=1 Tax=Oculatella sp. LEGE 06141 TaxID=1828648 RepID=UPI00187F6015|nr:methyl-accepting chemotaxis protein [Oculatella sp. LEGE 06141]MBE9181891.1 methyl-accepting chemotaxis protein [Oculatella sp. LEGE 06141]